MTSAHDAGIQDYVPLVGSMLVGEYSLDMV